ncbi:homoisocitrate dehydrogenase, partial [Dinochytrium kinnereticum]
MLSQAASSFKRSVSLHSRTLSTTPLKPLTIALIPADGIGKEVIPAAKDVLTFLLKQTHTLSFPVLDAGFELFQRTGESLPQATLDALKHVDGAMFGAVSSPSHKVAGYSSPIVALRKKMDLYANVRPVASPNKGKGGVDMVIVRENTECLYIKSERLETLPDGSKVAFADRKITSKASKRIATAAYNIALQRHAARLASGTAAGVTPTVTVVHKSNVLSVSDGLFRESCLEAWKADPRFKDVAVKEQLVDSMV